MGHPQGDSSSFLLLYISLSDYLPYNGYVVVVAFFFLKSFSFNFFNSKKNVIARVKEEENIIYHRDMRKKNEGLSKESKNELFWEEK